MADAISAAAVAVAVLSMLTTIYFSRRARKDALRSHDVAALAVRRAYLDGVHRWADEAVDATAEANSLCYRSDSEGFREVKQRVQWHLSALIDRGRWFFPNVSDEAYGQWKPTAYRGFRQTVLDDLVAIHDCVLDMPGDEEEAARRQRKDLLVEHRKRFVAFIQEFLDPRNVETELERLTAA